MQRYGFERGLLVEDSEHGQWVRYSDLAADRAEIERLKAESKRHLTEAETAEGLLKEAYNRAEKARAENERLTKERDSYFNAGTREMKRAAEALTRAEKAEAERDAWKENAEAMDSLLEGAVSYYPMASRSDVHWVERKKKVRAAHAKLKGDV